jgi:2-methylcitrate dehydratase PrpD
MLFAEFTSSQASDEATHARWTAENRCLDTNTAALASVQRMCAERALREVPPVNGLR